MLSEALELLHDTARKAAEARVLEVAGVPRLRWVSQCGELTEVKIPPADRRYEFFSLDSFCGFVEAQEDPIVFYGEDGITAQLERATRHETARLVFDETGAYETLLRHAHGQKLGQYEFIRMLRIELGIKAPELIGPLRNLKFRRNAEGHGDVQHGRESLGQSVESEITGSTAIPEEVSFAVQLFDQVGYQATVTAAIEILVEEQKFRLTPLVRQMHAALEMTMEHVSDALHVGLPSHADAIYHGKP